MAIKLGNQTTRKLKLTAIEPLNYGEVQKHTFEVELKIIPKAKWDDLWKQRVEDRPTDRDIIEWTLVDFVGLVDDTTNAPIEFDDDVKVSLLDVAWIVAPLIDAQIELQNGRAATLKRKN